MSTQRVRQRKSTAEVSRHALKPQLTSSRLPSRPNLNLLSNLRNARPGDLLALQRLVGNRAIQAQLKVGPAGDAYEQEADRVADQVMRPPAPALQRQADQPAKIQTKAWNPGAGFEASGEIENQLQAQKGGGHPLPAEVRAQLEPRFGANFAGVRVHADGQAAQLNRQLSAQAFTHGQDIYMGAGQYAPHSGTGQRLLAHELTHVIQQTGGARRHTDPQAVPVSGAAPDRLQCFGGKLPEKDDFLLVAGGGFKVKGQSIYTQILDLVDDYHHLEAEDYDAQYDKLIEVRDKLEAWQKKHGKEFTLFMPKRVKRRKVVAQIRASVAEEMEAVQQQRDELKQKEEEQQQLEQKNLKTLPDLDPKALSRSKNIGKYKLNAVGGQMNKLHKVTYKFGLKAKGALTKQVSGGKFVGYFKAQQAKDLTYGQHKGTATNIPELDPKFNERNLAMYEMDKLLGADVIPPTFKIEFQKKQGIIMEKVKGDTGANGGGGFADLPAQGKRALSKLYLLDIICAQVDRHPGNYIVMEDPKSGEVLGVKGIDNDLAFGEKYEIGLSKIGGKALFSFPVDRPFCVKIAEVANQPDKVKKALKGLLSDGEINATLARLKKLVEFLDPYLKGNVRGGNFMKATWK